MTYFAMLRAVWVIIRQPQAGKISCIPVRCGMRLTDFIGETFHVHSFLEEFRIVQEVKEAQER